MRNSLAAVWFWTAPLSLWHVRRLSLHYVPVCIHILRGDTSNAVGTSWEPWRKTTGEILQMNPLLLWSAFMLNSLFFLILGFWGICRPWETTSFWRLGIRCMISIQPSLTKFWRRRAGSSWHSSMCSCKRLLDSATQRTATGTAHESLEDLWFTIKPYLIPLSILWLNFLTLRFFSWFQVVYIPWNYWSCKKKTASE